MHRQATPLKKGGTRLLIAFTFKYPSLKSLIYILNLTGAYCCSFKNVTIVERKTSEEPAFRSALLPLTIASASSPNLHR
jgi:hypothetical protein